MNREKLEEALMCLEESILDEYVTLDKEFVVNRNGQHRTRIIGDNKETDWGVNRMYKLCIIRNFFKEKLDALMARTVFVKKGQGED